MELEKNEGRGTHFGILSYWHFAMGNDSAVSDKAKQLTELRLIKINLMSKFCHNSFLLNMCQFDTEGDLLSWCGTFGNSKLSIVREGWHYQIG